VAEWKLEVHDLRKLYNLWDSKVNRQGVTDSNSMDLFTRIYIELASTLVFTWSIMIYGKY